MTFCISGDIWLASIKNPQALAKQVQLKSKYKFVIITIAPEQSYPAASGPVVFLLFGGSEGRDVRSVSLVEFLVISHLYSLSC